MWTQPYDPFRHYDPTRHNDPTNGLIGAILNKAFDLVLKVMPAGLSGPAKLGIALGVALLVAFGAFSVWRFFICGDTEWTGGPRRD